MQLPKHDGGPYDLFTREQVAERLGINVAHVSELTKHGTLHSVRVGRRVLVPRASLEAYIRGETLDVDGGWPPTAAMFDLNGNPTA